MHLYINVFVGSSPQNIKSKCTWVYLCMYGHIAALTGRSSTLSCRSRVPEETHRSECAWPPAEPGRYHVQLTGVAAQPQVQKVTLLVLLSFNRRWIAIHHVLHLKCGLILQHVFCLFLFVQVCLFIIVFCFCCCFALPRFLFGIVWCFVCLLLFCFGYVLCLFCLFCYFIIYVSVLVCVCFCCSSCVKCFIFFIYYFPFLFWFIYFG